MAKYERRLKGSFNELLNCIYKVFNPDKATQTNNKNNKPCFSTVVEIPEKRPEKKFLIDNYNEINNEKMVSDKNETENK